MGSRPHLTPIPLRLGPLHAKNYSVQHSGIRWLRDDGHVCRPGEVIAFCNLGLARASESLRGIAPFAEEMRDFQVAFACTSGGRLRKAEAVSRGGFMDLHHHNQRWDPETIIGSLEPLGPESEPEPEPLRLLMVAGRRMTELAEDRSGLLTGWHDRSRAWWGDGEGAFGTVLSLGICDQLGIIRGDRFAFLEMFDAVRGPVQVVFVPDDTLVPTADVVLDRIRRGSVRSESLAADLAKSLSDGSIVPSAADWLFASCTLSALSRSPLSAGYDVLTRIGLGRTGPESAVVLSLNAESSVILRHRRLGYLVNFHAFRIDDTGPAIRHWLRTEFEPVKRTVADIQASYRALVDALANTGTKALIMNSLSTSGYEDLCNYVPFDHPMGETLASFHAKEMNLMLHDLAGECDVSIVDSDAIAADLGAAAHLPDGVHPSGPLQNEVRAEILRILHDRNIPGFKLR